MGGGGGRTRRGFDSMIFRCTRHLPSACTHLPPDWLPPPTRSSVSWRSKRRAAGTGTRPAQPCAQRAVGLWGCGLWIMMTSSLSVWPVRGILMRASCGPFLPVRTEACSAPGAPPGQQSQRGYVPFPRPIHSRNCTIAQLHTIHLPGT
jgi:hypothetical protein